MTLKNLFDMVKADRYTADGREELIKAQEAETEDKVYQIGEISEKTGLMKTANGWVKPKNGKQPGKTDKPNPNGVTAQQKQKMEAEKHEAARRDAQAPSNVNHLKDPNPGIPSQGNDIAINGKAYKAHLGDTILTKSGQKYEYAGKTSTGKIRVTSREGSTPITTAIDEKEILGLSEPENMSPKEKAALRTAESNTESKPAAPVKRNEAELVKHSDGTESYRIKGTQFYFKTPEEAESALLAESRYGKSYATASKDPEINNIQEALGFKLDMLGSGKSMDKFMKKIGENEYAANVWGFGTDSKGTLITPLDETDNPNSVIKKENGEWKLHYTGRDGKKTVVTANGRQDPTSDAAPRVLTGDTRIRVRKA